MHLKVGHARVLEGRDPILDVAEWTTERRQLQEFGRYGRLGLFLLAREVEVLNDFGFLLVAVADGEFVIEVLTLRSHAAHVERDHGTLELAKRRHLGALADGE